MEEDKTLELKEKVSNTFLKTVSAFANFARGKILFGIKVDGTILGIENPDGQCLDIENKINDNIKPKPRFNFTINRKNNVITLEVHEGIHKPYLYKGKAYRRSNRSSIEVDSIELRRLVLLGSNLHFEELPYTEKTLRFDSLEKALKEKLKIEKITTDVLRTLGFFTNELEYNKAAAIFADHNSFFGVDIVRFGNSINEILDRETITKQSILEQYDRAVYFYKKYYQYEEIKGIERNLVEKVPEEAFREAMANALVHRTWDINAHIRVEMYPDRIEIASPGGLTIGLTEEDYLSGSISILRNPIIGNIFFRLNYIEMFGTGIRRILDSYSHFKIKPSFRITDNTITVSLPTTKALDVSSDERKILDSLSPQMNLASSEIVQLTGFSKDKVIRLLNQLIEKEYVKVIGRGRGTKYTT